MLRAAVAAAGVRRADGRSAGRAGPAPRSGSSRTGSACGRSRAGSPAQRGGRPGPVSAGAVMMADLPALHDALDCATAATLAVQDGDRDRADLALLEASAAGASAFPPGSREAEALGVIFTAIFRAEAEPDLQPGGTNGVPAEPLVSLAEPELG